MREYEFTKQIDVLAICRYDLHNFLIANPQIISESTQNSKEYKNFIDYEESNTVGIDNLIKNKMYAVMFLHALPAASYMRIAIAPNNTSFHGISGNKLHFKTKLGHNIMFPTKTRDTNNSYANTLVFNSIYEQKQFIALLKSQYNSWTISVNKL